MPKFALEKTILINAPIETVFATVRDFTSWPKWSPWSIAEPACNVTFSEDGKTYSWDGDIIGSGILNITGESANTSIDYTITFLKPMKSTSSVGFSFRSVGDATEASWSMSGSLPFFLFFLKPMLINGIGGDYQRGLRMLKDLVETGSVPSQLSWAANQNVSGFNYVGLARETSLAEVQTSLTEDLKTVHAWITENNVPIAGPVVALYPKFHMSKGLVSYIVAYPVSEKPSDLPPSFVYGSIPDSQNYEITHSGPYCHLGNAWAVGQMHMRAKLFAQNKSIPPFERYITDPGETPENKAITAIHFPSQ